MKANKFIGLVAAGAISVLAGCKTSGPIAEYEKRGGVYTGLNWRLAYTPTYYDTTLKESKNIPVHPDDTGFLTGSTEVKARDGLDYLAFSTGLEGLAGAKNFALTGGLDLAFDMSCLLGKGRGYMYDYKQQRSDTRSEDSGSFCFDRIDPPIIAPIPFVGARAWLGDFTINAELGFPYKRFTREWGHHRWGKEEKIGSESDAQWTLKPSIGIGMKTEDKGFVSIEVSQEEHDLKFGNIKATTLMISYTKEF